MKDEKWFTIDDLAVRMKLDNFVKRKGTIEIINIESKTYIKIDGKQSIKKFIEELNKYFGDSL